MATKKASVPVSKVNLASRTTTPAPAAAKKGQLTEAGLRATGVKLDQLEKKRRSSLKTDRAEQLPFAERLRVFEK